MGKKGKGTKKDEKAKKEPTSARVAGSRASDAKSVMEALHGKSATASAPPTRPASTPRTAASKKSERSSKGWIEKSFQWNPSEEAPVLPPIEQCFELAAEENAKLLRAAEQNAKLFRVYGTTRRLLQLQGFKKPLHSTFDQLNDGGWDHFLPWRCCAGRVSDHHPLTTSAKESKTLKDGLSGPLAIVFAILRWTLIKSKAETGEFTLEAMETDKPLHVVVVGATAAYEEKILRESDHWNELFALLGKRKVRLYLTGSEMSGKDGVFKKDEGRGDQQEQQAEGQEEKTSSQRSKPYVECWKANAIDFFLQKGRLELFQKEDTVVVGLNCGLDVAACLILKPPSGKLDPNAPTHEVLWDWIPTLHFIAALDLPLILTGSYEKGAMHANMLLQHVVGMYTVHPIMPVTTSSVSTFPGPGDDSVKANTNFLIVQGQQPGVHFPTRLVQQAAGDARFDAFRKRVAESQASRLDWPMHLSVRKPSDTYGRERVSQLVPLQRYGNYPPKNAADGESDSDIPAGEEAVPPLAMKLKHSFEEESGNLKIVVEDVFMTDPAAARVGVRRNSFALHYFDCERLRDAVFEAALPKEVDHTTARVVFRRSKLSLVIVVRLVGSDK